MSAVIDAHKHAASHRAELLSSRECGCFYCLSVFAPRKIMDWVDWPLDTPEGKELELALPRSVRTVESTR